MTFESLHTINEGSDQMLCVETFAIQEKLNNGEIDIQWLSKEKKSRWLFNQKRGLPAMPSHQKYSQIISTHSLLV